MWRTPGGVGASPMIRVLSRDVAVGFVGLSIVHTPIHHGPSQEDFYRAVNRPVRAVNRPVRAAN
eukprot:5141766-Pyramimonas_sp.AAC.2